MVQDTLQQSSCCMSDQRSFLGKQSNGDNDSGSDGTPSKTRTAPVHIGNFVGCDPDDRFVLHKPSTSVRSLTMGSSEDDQDLVSRMMKSAAARLKRECIDERTIATIEESGTVGWLRHSQIELGEKLGDGSFSSVFEIKSIDTDGIDRLSRLCLSHEKGGSENPVSPSRQLVIKILKPKLVRSPSTLSLCSADLVKEGVILALLGKHPNLVSLVAWTPTGLGGFSDSSCGIRHDFFFLVLGRLEKSLEDRLTEWRSEKAMFEADTRQGGDAVNWQERLQIMTDLANVVQHVHSKGIIHRDLKPNNIGFDSRGILKFFDFDVSRIIPKEVSKQQHTSSSSSRSNNNSSSSVDDETFRLTQHVGTQRYMSPECGRGEPYNAKADVYAFGLVCHEILSLEIPYSEFHGSEAHYQSVFLSHERPSLPRRWPRILRNFLGSCWSNAIHKRPTMEKAFGFLCKEAPSIASGLERKSSHCNWNYTMVSLKAAMIDSLWLLRGEREEQSLEAVVAKKKSSKRKTNSGNIFRRRTISSSFMKGNSDPGISDPSNQKERIALDTAKTCTQHTTTPRMWAHVQLRGPYNT